MKIKITGMAFTPLGVFDKGQILTDEKYDKAFLTHLVKDAGAAEWIEKDSLETKVVEVEVIKKPQSTPSSQPAKASKKKITKKRSKKPK